MVAILLMSVFAYGDPASLQPWVNRYHGLPPISLRSVAYGNGMFVSVGDAGVILTSQNGEDWTQQSSGSGVDLKALIFGGGRFVVVGAKGTILTSTDTVVWNSSNSGVSQDLRAGIFAKNEFYVVGGTRQCSRIIVCTKIPVGD